MHRIDVLVFIWNPSRLVSTTFRYNPSECSTHCHVMNVRARIIIQRSSCCDGRYAIFYRGELFNHLCDMTAIHFKYHNLTPFCVRWGGWLCVRGLCVCVRTYTCVCVWDNSRGQIYQAHMCCTYKCTHRQTHTYILTHTHTHQTTHIHIPWKLTFQESQLVRWCLRMVRSV